MTQRFFEIAKIFGKWLRSMGHGLRILDTAYVCCKELKYLKYAMHVC